MTRSPKLSASEKENLVRSGYDSIVLEGAGGIATSPVWSKLSKQGSNGRILVIVELSGGNDGLNTVIPYADDAYYRARPHLGIREDQALRIDDYFAFQKSMQGFERLYKDGQMAIVHGVGYDQPSFSHFSSMAFWQTGAPNSGEAYGWLGRMADAIDPEGHGQNFLVNIDDHQSLAVKARHHVPLVFDDPEKFSRRVFHEEAGAIAAGDAPGNVDHNPSLDYLFEIAASASRSERLVREAWASYQTPVDYGLVNWGLERVAALIAADFPTQVYYVPFRNNAFDTHVHQGNLHSRLWSYTSDHIAAFLRDMDRLGRGDDVVLMAFSEFGRRVSENTSLGTDHGTAGPAFIIGKPIHGGHYGGVPSLTDLDGGNLRYTTDFRRLYATLIRGWMGHDAIGTILKQEFEPLPVFAAAA
ncbi:DUF1501 domain-containing protein [Ponticoccus sp. SC2-23]|uniref:DUF1501 domain-containing protein n=1 Tax=Alexandriicola marinus TaxID=2081710 RepID=UPI000FDC9978|nr:DUF1501 domain-containing protein [Alexandriicola marinus]MBM1218637.1 DUF1501 domain-containing protein [Ponticoccus sp. SC6-9]MBM1224291.1 DUF1501 domain-containing protein [Ponticoccus sp. SC6-15]MBM1229930.1 DUF1501 domain-containing protein [Ponticoccus sp. SC6-38]MBM1233257.1 DUF1501 domain-containing protein [Ponticoccus sp. SC6-45]MBM1236793.1 DUF1501 domain-containing protein [Ponticoccus sp. SC6-49]MBM1242268.1 DUF1501 domain-containing protein [Ponticoccus sp. SC2-64]MBM1246781